MAGCSSAPVAYQPAPLSAAASPAIPDQPLPSHAGTWQEADLVLLAVDRSPAVRKAVADLRAARLQAMAARVKAPITLTLSTEYANEAGAESPWLFGFGFDIPLERGDVRTARLTAADLPIVRARYALAAAVWKVQADVHQAFIESQYQRYFASRARTLVQMRQALLDLATARVRAGQDPASLQRQAVADVSAAQKQLDSFLALADGADRVLEDVLRIPEGGLSAAALQPIVAPNNTPIPAYPPMRLQALLSRPEVLDALAAYDQAEAALRGEVVKQYPAISIGPGFTWERGLTKLPFNLSLTLPPRDRNRAAIDAAEALRSAAGLALEAAQAQILADADRAFAAWNDASGQSRRLHLTDLPASQAEVDTAANLASAGETSGSDLVAARLGQAQLQLDAALAQHQAWQARAALEATLQTSFDAELASALTAKIQALGAE